MFRVSKSMENGAEDTWMKEISKKSRLTRAYVPELRTIRMHAFIQPDWRRFS